KIGNGNDNERSVDFGEMDDRKSIATVTYSSFPSFSFRYSIISLFAMERIMSTKSTKTIDDLGIQAYTHFEDVRASYEEEFILASKNIAYQLGADVFEPILISEFNLL